MPSARCLAPQQTPHAARVQTPQRPSLEGLSIGCVSCRAMRPQLDRGDALFGRMTGSSRVACCQAGPLAHSVEVSRTYRYERRGGSDTRQVLLARTQIRARDWPARPRRGNARSYLFEQAAPQWTGNGFRIAVRPRVHGLVERRHPCPLFPSGGAHATGSTPPPPWLDGAPPCSLKPLPSSSFTLRMYSLTWAIYSGKIYYFTTYILSCTRIMRDTASTSRTRHS